MSMWMRKYITWKSNIQRISLDNHWSVFRVSISIYDWWLFIYASCSIHQHQMLHRLREPHPQHRDLVVILRMEGPLLLKYQRKVNLPQKIPVAPSIKDREDPGSHRDRHLMWVFASCWHSTFFSILYKVNRRNFAESDSDPDDAPHDFQVISSTILSVHWFWKHSINQRKKGKQRATTIESGSEESEESSSDDDSSDSEDELIESDVSHTAARYRRKGVKPHWPPEKQKQEVNVSTATCRL